MTMHDSLTDFIRQLKQRGLVEQAQAFCTSWQNGYIAQDANGEVDIYNGPVAMGYQEWIIQTPHAHLTNHRLANLKPSGFWRNFVLPVRELLQPQAALSGAPLAFYKALNEAGIIEKVYLLLNSWQKNSWLALDADGLVCLFNNQPVKRAGKWGMSGANRLDGAIGLGRILPHGLHWEKYLVKLSLIGQPQQLTITLDMHNVNRMDCWI